MKKIDIKNKRFGNCISLYQIRSENHNTKYRCLCDCGQLFTTYSQSLRIGQIDCCKKCRKKRYRLKIKAIKVPIIIGIKYTLMNIAKTKIIEGKNGKFIYFSELKAKIAARLMGAVVVEIKEAEKLSSLM